jgi:hypothetical protein
LVADPATAGERSRFEHSHRERYAASTATIETAVDDAAWMQGRTEAETAEIYADLQRREAAIQSVLQYLDKAATSASS